MDANRWREDLALAHELARGAAQIALPLFDAGADVRVKDDGTPVTSADLAVERFLVTALAKHRPRDGIVGEELGTSSRGDRRWILDPIDGTANFVAGKPQWGTHIALESAGELVLGVISRPVLAQHWWATRGGGAYRGPAEFSESHAVRLQVSTTSSLAASTVAVWTAPDHPLVDRVRGVATLGNADLDAILHLAEGSLDAVIDAVGREWDHAPAVVVVEEAGGRFSDAAGGRRIDRGEGRYTNGRIHEALVGALNGER